MQKGFPSKDAQNVKVTQERSNKSSEEKEIKVGSFASKEVSVLKWWLCTQVHLSFRPSALD